MHSRGARVTITKNHITVERSALSKVLLPHGVITQEELLGWYHRPPEDCSPGYIHLLTDHTIIPLHFSPHHEDEYQAIESTLRAWHAGYDLPAITTPQSGHGNPEENTHISHHDSHMHADNDHDAHEKHDTRKTDKKNYWSHVTTPTHIPAPNPKADPNSIVYNQVVCLTGEMDPYTKAEVWDMIAHAGGHVTKNVTKKTTILIIGHWNGTTTKEKRARELQAKGQHITLMPLADFLHTI